jgi:tRNA/rRNA methyltransferase
VRCISSIRSASPILKPIGEPPAQSTSYARRRFATPSTKRSKVSRSQLRVQRARREIAVPAETARIAAARALEVARSQPVAFVFGNETYGLTTEEVNKCALLAFIPANPRYSSLNLAAAVQVIAYELRLAAEAPRPSASSRKLASHEQVEAFYEYLEGAMAQTGFLNREHPKKLMPRLRRLFARAQLESEEVNILRGVLKALSQPRKR